ncbi:hypothetical protein CVT25_014461 [Psilocybe cyanescens]|uniref:DUF155 domain-containing protein n=1 Tax=Psilocybe cyanescens TaxID=93625 RepID=A0A409XR88_PSICY|nr:hypothetical protein CVT25_014461 [Psilocybe cyanescens]
MSRRASVIGLTSGPKSQRTSKTTHKLVELPSALLVDVSNGLALGHEADGAVWEHKSQVGRMNKVQRKEAGFKRITAYCVAESFKIKLLSSFLKREHNVSPRAFDEALYVMYYLPLLLGYGPNANIRPSVPVKTRTKKTFPRNDPQVTRERATFPRALAFKLVDPGPENTLPLSGLPPPAETDEENDPGFVTDPGSATGPDVGFAAEPEPESETPVSEIIPGVVPTPYEIDPGVDANPGVYSQWKDPVQTEEPAKQREEEVAEVMFFDPQIPLTLLKLSIAHALAQSTLLARSETNARRVLSSPLTLSIPKQLAVSGALKHRRHEALKLTGRLFTLRRDINLVECLYMEIGPRVQTLNEKLRVASDLLDAICDHLNNSAMERITWIVIWLVLVACLDELVAILIFHAATTGTKMEALAAASPFALPSQISQEETLKVPERLVAVQSQSQS